MDKKHQYHDTRIRHRRSWPTRIKTKGIVREKINKAFKEQTESTGKEKHKVQHLQQNTNISWTPRTKPNYMNKLTRLEVSVIFKARMRMPDIQNNYWNKYPDLICRRCGKQDETHQHILEKCETIYEKRGYKNNKQ